MATGNYPGKATNAAELRSDLAEAMSLIPGPPQGQPAGNIRRLQAQCREDRGRPEHFDGWIRWAKENRLGLDFASTYFSHPKSDTGFTLSSKDEKIRSFWVEHAMRSRLISAHIGKALSTPCIHDLWIPDGMKDNCVDRIGYRRLLTKSLDEIYTERYPQAQMKDA
jgi:L-rhamnose isomerase